MGTDKPFFALKLEKRAKTSSRRGRVVRTARTCLKSPEDFYHLRIRKWPGGVGPIQPLTKMALVNASLDDIVEARHRDLSHAEKLKMSSSQKPPSSYKVSVSNLKHQDLDVKELTQMFADFGKVLSLKVVTKEGKDEPDVSIRFKSKEEAKAAAECWNQVCVGDSVLNVSVVSSGGGGGGIKGDHENLSDQSFTCSETSAAPHHKALAGSALFGTGRNKKKWKRGRAQVSKQQLDDELEQYMNQRKS